MIVPDTLCGCCGHPRRDHGPASENTRCWGPRGNARTCLCPEFVAPFDSTSAPDGRPGVYVQVTTPLGHMPPEQPPRIVCARCGASLEPQGAVRHDCGLRGEHAK